MNVRLISSRIRLGENPAFLLVFYQFLGDRFKDGEYSGGFIASMLEVSTTSTLHVTAEKLMAESS